MKVDETKYPDFNVKLITASCSDEVPFATEKEFIRVEIPSNAENSENMKKKGYTFVERTLGVEISLKRSKIDYQKMIRFLIKQVNPKEKEILEIALDSFPIDRRFHVSVKPDMNVAEPIIRKWIKELSEVYACVHKDQIVGFLDLEPYGENDCFIHLAAVQERYRAVGAAVSLYAYAILVAKEKGCEKVYGRISSMNTAVMNLYAQLGGVFSTPMDIFVRNEI